MLPLDIRREIGSIRALKGQNWLAIALGKIQDFSEQLPLTPATTPTTTPATATTNGGSSAQTPQVLVEVNGYVLAKSNFNDVLPPPPTGMMSVQWLVDTTLTIPNVSGNVRNSGGVDARTSVTETISLASQGELVTLNNVGAVTVTLDSTIASTFACGVLNRGAGTATLTPSSGLINGSASLALLNLQGTFLFFDGTNWWAVPEPVSATSFADAETPTDSGDHQHFTLAHSPSPAGSLQLILKGTSYFNQPLFPVGVDYTLAGAAITMNAAITGSFHLLGWYRY